MYRQEVVSTKCLWNYFSSKFYPDEPKGKNLELYGVTVRPTIELCPATEAPISISDPVNKDKIKDKSTGYNINNRDEKHKKLTSFTSKEKKKSIQIDKNTTEVEGTRRTSFDSYMDWKPAEGNWTTFGLHLEIPVTDKIILQICAVEIAFILILLFSLRHYVLELKSIKNSANEVTIRAQSIAYSTADDYMNTQRYPEREEETEPSTINDELALMTASSMIFSHLQNLVNEIKTRKPEENLEKYLTNEFLEMISDRIAQEDFMRSNFQSLLTAESLFKLGQLYYCQKTKNSGHLNHRDVRVNLGVHVGGQEIKIPQSNTKHSIKQEIKTSQSMLENQENSGRQDIKTPRSMEENTGIKEMKTSQSQTEKQNSSE